MAARILVVMPDGEQLYANYPTEPETWKVEEGRDFFNGLMQKAFRTEPGVRHAYVTTVERVQAGLMVAIRVKDRTITIGPFNPSDEGLAGIRGNPEFEMREPKDIPKH